MRAEAGNAAGPLRGLIVSSFVLPHAGGVEQFVDVAASLLRREGWHVRVLACRPPAGAPQADSTVPTRFLGTAGWPLPVGGWRVLWREVGAADVVIANGTRHLLPSVAVLAARLRGKRVVFILHGSGAPFSTSSFFYHRVLGRLFERLVARPALRVSQAVSLSRAGVRGSRSRYGVVATYVPFPLRELPPAMRAPLEPDEPLRIVWVGRLYGEKNPLAAVEVVERVRLRRAARLEVYGSGPLLGALEALARDRPWLAVRGSRTWEEIQEIQGTAHLCLSTSLREGTQVAVLEPLARGIPVVSTRVGDAPGYYERGLRAFCVEPRDSEAAAEAILALADSYDRYRRRFAANSHELVQRHGDGARRLAAVFGSPGSTARDGASGERSRAELPVT
jgi:glycosyltransferase involved in cell wall biosynthesis